jgi:2-haloacid dehalogenase
VGICVFDIGGVLLDWDPRHLYRKLFEGDDGAMEDFLATVCTLEWNGELDRGTSFEEAARPLLDRHSDQAELILAYHDRWDEMVSGEIAGTADIVRRLGLAGNRVYGLTNFWPDSFRYARTRYEVLRLFDGFVVSGEEGITKPDPRIYLILCERFGFQPREAVFVDDAPANVRAAEELGFRAILFSGPGALEASLKEFGLLPA